MSGSTKKTYPVSKPYWAALQHVIGYTWSLEIKNVGQLADLQTIGGQAKELPSVYYVEGHATLDHASTWNVGWKGGMNETRIFFGNVPEQTAHRLSQLHGKKKEEALADLLKDEWNYLDFGGLAWQDLFTLPTPPPGLWRDWDSVVTPQRPHLYEVSRRNGSLVTHPSRNAFRFARDQQIRHRLHALATDASLLEMMKAGSAAQDRRGVAGKGR